MDSADEFSEFAGAAAPRLYRTAFLLCGDWHTAQDLAQTTLAKVFVCWRRIQRQDGAHAYAHRTLVNSYLAMARRRSSTETPVSILTAKSAELLLLDLLPASTTHLVSSQAANAHDGTEVTAQADPRSTSGSGTAIAAMSRTRVSHLPSCASQVTGQYGDLACRTYHLPGGVSVQETLQGSTPSPKGGADRYVVAVTVLRADGLAVSVQASSYRFDTFHEKGLTTSPPMTVSQLVRAAADPRWSLRMPRAFVARARSVRLPGPKPKG